jgi:hypothetical protein
MIMLWQCQLCRRNLTLQGSTNSVGYVAKYKHLSTPLKLLLLLLGVIHSVAWAKNTLWACPRLSICCVFPMGLGNMHDRFSAHQWAQRQIDARWPQITLVQGWPKDHTSATMTYVIWREEHLWNVGVLQRVYPSSLVILLCPTTGLRWTQYVANVPVAWPILRPQKEIPWTAGDGGASGFPLSAYYWVPLRSPLVLHVAGEGYHHQHYG